MRRALTILIAALPLLAFVLVASGCSQRFYADTGLMFAANGKQADPCARGDCLISLNRQAAARLAKTLEAAGVQPGLSIAAASFVQVDDLAASSTLGRLIPEQLAAELSGLGYPTVDLASDEPLLTPTADGGMRALAPGTLPVAKAERSQAVLLGTYSVASDTVYVTARIVRNADSVVLAGDAYALPITPNLRSLAGWPEPVWLAQPTVLTTLSEAEAAWLLSPATPVH